MRPPKTQIPTPLGTQPPPHRLLHKDNGLGTTPLPVDRINKINDRMIKRHSLID